MAALLLAIAAAIPTTDASAQDASGSIAALRAAAKAGDVHAADTLGFQLFVKGDRKTAMPLIAAAAARGDPRALYVLGTARFNGDYVPRDVPRAYAEMRRAAAAGLPQAVRSLAIMEPYVSPADRARADALADAPIGDVTAAQVVAAPAAAPAASSPPTRPSAPKTALPIPAPTAPITAEAGGGWRVQLGAYGSSDRAEAQWRQIAARLPALAALHHLLAPAGALVRLQADGLAGRADAEALCRSVTESGGGCFVVAPER